MEELKLKYEIKTYKRTKTQEAPPELKEIHPLGKAPIVTIESETASKPLVLAESGLIMEYLIDHYGPWLVPKRYAEGKEGQVGGETEEWLRYRYIMHYAEGSLMPYLLLSILMKSKFKRLTQPSHVAKGIISHQQIRSIFYQTRRSASHRRHRVELLSAKSEDQLRLFGKPDCIFT